MDDRVVHWATAKTRIAETWGESLQNSVRKTVSEVRSTPGIIILVNKLRLTTPKTSESFMVLNLRWVLLQGTLTARFHLQFTGRNRGDFAFCRDAMMQQRARKILDEQFLFPQVMQDLE